jgi:hypothetical protein
MKVIKLPNGKTVIIHRQAEMPEWQKQQMAERYQAAIKRNQNNERKQK